LPLKERLAWVKDVREETVLETVRRAEGGIMSFRAERRSAKVSSSTSSSSSASEISESAGGKYCVRYQSIDSKNDACHFSGVGEVEMATIIGSVGLESGNARFDIESRQRKMQLAHGAESVGAMKANRRRHKHLPVSL
jgi:hypothetical protein